MVAADSAGSNDVTLVNGPNWVVNVIDCNTIAIPDERDVLGDIETDDLNFFILVLLGLDTDPDHVAASDLNMDGLADGDDVQMFVDELLAP